MGWGGRDPRIFDPRRCKFCYRPVRVIKKSWRKLSTSNWIVFALGGFFCPQGWRPKWDFRWEKSMFLYGALSSDLVYINTPNQNFRRKRLKVCVFLHNILFSQLNRLINEKMAMAEILAGQIGLNRPKSGGTRRYPL